MFDDILKYFKKGFNIACLLGLHDYVPITRITKGDVDYIVREQFQSKGADPFVINSLPFPKDYKGFLTTKVCACCSHTHSDITNYSLTRSNLYNRLYDKHYKAVMKYLDDNKELLQQVQRKLEYEKKQAEKGAWTLDDK